MHEQSTTCSSVTVTHSVLSHLILFHGGWSQWPCDQRWLRLHRWGICTRPLPTTSIIHSKISDFLLCHLNSDTKARRLKRQLHHACKSNPSGSCRIVIGSVFLSRWAIKLTLIEIFTAQFMWNLFLFVQQLRCKREKQINMIQKCKHAHFLPEDGRQKDTTQQQHEDPHLRGHRGLD